MDSHNKYIVKVSGKPENQVNLYTQDKQTRVIWQVVGDFVGAIALFGTLFVGLFIGSIFQ